MTRSPVLGERRHPTGARVAAHRMRARAFRCQCLPDGERNASISEMTAADELDRSYLDRLLQLTLLVPDIVEAIVEGRQAST